MSNPIMDQLDSNRGGIMNLINTIRHASNPKQMIEQMVLQNPQMSAVMQEVNKNGGDARKAFYAKAQQMGVDPNSILNMLK